MIDGWIDNLYILDVYTRQTDWGEGGFNKCIKCCKNVPRAHNSTSAKLLPEGYLFYKTSLVKCTGLPNAMEKTNLMNSCGKYIYFCTP